MRSGQIREELEGSWEDVTLPDREHGHVLGQREEFDTETRIGGKSKQEDREVELIRDCKRPSGPNHKRSQRSSVIFEPDTSRPPLTLLDLLTLGQSVSNSQKWLWTHLP